MKKVCVGLYEHRRSSEAVQKKDGEVDGENTHDDEPYFLVVSPHKGEVFSVGVYHASEKYGNKNARKNKVTRSYTAHIPDFFGTKLI